MKVKLLKVLERGYDDYNGVYNWIVEGVSDWEEMEQSEINELKGMMGVGDKDFRYILVAEADKTAKILLSELKAERKAYLDEFKRKEDERLKKLEIAKQKREKERTSQTEKKLLEEQEKIAAKLRKIQGLK